MPTQELRRALEELERQLDAAPELDAESRALLEEAKADIQEHLGRGDHPPDWGDRLRDGVNRFEQEHPRLTNVVNRIALSLAELGI